ATGFALNLLDPQNNGAAGEVPILIHHAKSGRTVAISGQGVAPRAATLEWFRERNIKLIPGDGLLPATVPAAVDTWVTALAEFGTLSLGEVIAPALDLAENGFPVYHTFRDAIAGLEARFREEWPSSAAVYLPEGRVPEWGERFRNPEWAATFRKLVDEEK